MCQKKRLKLKIINIVENKINHSEKKNLYVNSLWENHKEFLKKINIKSTANI